MKKKILAVLLSAAMVWLLQWQWDVVQAEVHQQNQMVKAKEKQRI